MPGWYPALLDSVSARVATGRQRAVPAVNNELIGTYWAIGRDIIDRQDEEGYGTRVIDRLSADLRERFPDGHGYSPRNLKYMRAFAAAWPDPEVVQGRLARLPWYHQDGRRRRQSWWRCPSRPARVSVPGGWLSWDRMRVKAGAAAA
jgi:hypothetical protein